MRSGSIWMAKLFKQSPHLVRGDLGQARTSLELLPIDLASDAHKQPRIATTGPYKLPARHQSSPPTEDEKLAQISFGVLALPTYPNV